MTRNINDRFIIFFIEDLQIPFHCIIRDFSLERLFASPSEQSIPHTIKFNSEIKPEKGIYLPIVGKTKNPRRCGPGTHSQKSKY